MTQADRARRYRDRQRGGQPRTPTPCGTSYGAVRRHQRNKEPLCAACRAFLHDQYEKRKKT